MTCTNSFALISEWCKPVKFLYVKDTPSFARETHRLSSKSTIMSGAGDAGLNVQAGHTDYCGPHHMQ